MTTTWAIAPYENKRIWDDIWQFDRANSLISIGWSQLGIVVSLDDGQITKKVKIRYPEKTPRSIDYILSQFRFLRGISVGHKILARKGLRQLAGLGVVTKSHFDDPTIKLKSKIHDYDLRNHLSVKWISTFEPISFEKDVFRQYTIWPFTDLKIFRRVAKYFKDDVSEGAEAVLINSSICDIASIPIGSEVPDRAKMVVSRYQRNDSVRKFILKMASGECEFCGKRGFPLPDGRHYLEAHHVINLSNQGADTKDNVIALCPSDHRESHYGVKADIMENEMIKIIKRRNLPRQR